MGNIFLLINGYKLIGGVALAGIGVLVKLVDDATGQAMIDVGLVIAGIGGPYDEWKARAKK